LVITYRPVLLEANTLKSVQFSNAIPVETIRAAQGRISDICTRSPLTRWQRIQRDHCYEDAKGALIHPFADADVMAGNGTITLEILDDLPDVDAIVVPYGGGGLSCGIASAIKVLRPAVNVYAAEAQNAAPLAASLQYGPAVDISYESSFVTGMGAPFVFPSMWPLAKGLLDKSIVVPPKDIAEAIRRMATRSCIIAEGAGAVAPAAALTGKAGSGKIVAIVSGGIMDTRTLISILSDELF
jgi:threonine dehydratase